MKLADTVFYNKGRGSADGNNYWKRCRVPHYVYIFLMLILLGIGIGIISLFICGIYLDKLGWETFRSYFVYPMILLLNLLPCVLLVILFYFITGRAYLAFGIPAALIFAMSVINYYKIRIRSEAFVAADISLADEAAGILSRYHLELSGRVLLPAAALVLGILFTVFFMPGKLKGVWTRVIGAAVTAAVFAALFTTVYINPKVYYRINNERIDINRWSDFQVFVSKGFVYPFMYSIPDALPQKPEGYSGEEAAAILSQYEEGSIDADKKVSVIAVMLESYTDLSEHSEVPVFDFVYAPLHELERECLHGHIISNTFGGGTTDSERSFLTGYTVNENYRRTTNSFVYYLRGQGYYTEGVHPNNGWFYNRQNVTKYLGFDNYYFIEDIPQNSRLDKDFLRKITELYEARDMEKPYFSFSISMQNHGAYLSDETCSTAYLDSRNISEESFNILNNYLEGIADTTKRMRDFIDSFRNSDEPVVIVFFGDHMPWLGDGDSVYTELGIDINISRDQGFYNYYSTPYIIWANDAAKTATGGSFTGEGGDMSACFLMNRLFDECSWGKSAYMQSTAELYTAANIVSTSKGIYCVDGALTKEKTGKFADVLRRHQFTEYYMKHNFMYGELCG